MSRFTESVIDDLAIKLFDHLSNDYIPAPVGDNTLSELMSGEVWVAA